MAQGDLTIFNKAKEWEGDGTLDYDTNTFKIAILDNTTAPTAADASPLLATYTQVAGGGSYTTGGDAITLTWVESGGTVTLDAGDPTWAAHGSNDADAYWAFIFQSGTHNSITDGGVCFIDLGGPVDMSVSPLTIVTTSGLFTKS